MSIVAAEVGKSGRRKRRSWTLKEKRRIVDDSLEDGASIAEIARLHDLNASQQDASKNPLGKSAFD